MRRELHVGVSVLWVLGIAAVSNVGAACLPDALPSARSARWVSSFVGMGAWAALIGLTGGITSPLVAGFWLEIVFSAIVFPPRGTLAVTAGSVSALLVVYAEIGPRPESGRLGLATGFVIAIGLLTFYASRRWRLEKHSLSVEAAALSQRLCELERELEAARTLGQVGERVARLAHSLKNTVHSLRGFSKLIEAPKAGGAAQEEALQGLRLAIDRLQETIGALLNPARADAAPSSSITTPTELCGTLEAVITEVARDHANVRWVNHARGRLLNVALPPALLHEVLLILARNAAEASGESGEVALRADVEAKVLHLVVEDRGPGIDPGVRSTLFRPGVTTKPLGSGYGLFLARRLVESRGGNLTVGHAVHGGASVSVRLPVSPSPS